MSKTTAAYTRKTDLQRQQEAPPPLPNRLVRLLSEARWILLGMLTLYLILILMTYFKVDPGW